MKTLGSSEVSRGSGIPVRELRLEAQSLTAGEFEDRHGRSFLLLTATDLALPGGPASTAVRLEHDVSRRGDSTVGLSLLAYPLRRSGRSAGHLITLGRAANNDVVIPDLSISRFQAFVKEAASGSLLLQDAGSTNGTTVNGRSVPQQGHGAPVELKTGDNVRLGQVELTYLEADALLSFAAKLER